MGCFWWVSPKLLGQACWRCLVVFVIVWRGVTPGDFCPGRGVLCPSYVLFWWMGCVWLVVAWLLWSASSGAW